MFDGLLKSKFYTKCKSHIKLLKKRLEVIRKKKSVIEKYLTNDIADLLRNGTSTHAYDRVTGLLEEQNKSACYEYIEKYCDCISDHLAVMNNQGECPEECKEAVPSLMLAAARFSDLPELRDMRSLFTEKYGNSLASYANTEFAEMLKLKPPTKEMKIQLLQDIAKESNIEWDGKSLEKKQYTAAPTQKYAKCGYLRDPEVDKFQKNKDNAVPQRDNQDAGSGLSKGNGSSTRRNDSEDERTLPHNGLRSSSSYGSLSESELEQKRPSKYKYMPPPYLKPKADKNQSSSEDPPAKLEGNGDMEAAQEIDDPVLNDLPIPRPVRMKSPKPPSGNDNVGSSARNGATKTDSNGIKREGSKMGLRKIRGVDIDRRKEEEMRLDRALMQFGRKQSLFESGQTQAFPKPPHSQQRDHEYSEYRRSRTKSDSVVAPARAASLPPEQNSPEVQRKHVRATSLQPEILRMAAHVHPKLPEYDELAARIAALRGR